ncbi:hypothetical protein [Chachezhania antarctica]|uniref:hypothetical protein n=1 Tax=Chachezhania antarctica TaxID=2340860 RepID=UPI000EAD4BAA|nr:hypothetical protein [Chachezhania antarctica]|tara:strand:- start:25 stop:297 length:273 start_codon:yes stop_codon:yes gene_type:complete
MPNASARIAVLGAVVLGAMVLSGCEGSGVNKTPGLTGELREKKLQCDAGNYAMCADIGHAMADERHEKGMWDGNRPWTTTTHNALLRAPS